MRLPQATIKLWRSLASPGRPYATAVSPPVNATGVERNAAISATFENLGAVTPELKVNGEVVSYATSTDGSASTITYSPITPFDAGQTVTVDLAYGDASSTWTFVAKSGRKAVLITGGGQLNAADGWVANRLGSKFGFDVTVVGDGAVTVDGATGAGLIFNSSTVNSGNQLAFMDDIFWGQTDGWTDFSTRLPEDAWGQKIRVQWALLTDGDEPNGSGFYLDDVLLGD